jgi:hypothetical protein
VTSTVRVDVERCAPVYPRNLQFLLFAEGSWVVRADELTALFTDPEAAQRCVLPMVHPGNRLPYEGQC